MTHAWLSAVAALAVAAALSFGAILLWIVLRVRPRRAPPPTRELTYECGEEPEGLAWVRFHPRYYLVALVFVLFDVEAIFLFPWAVALGKLAPGRFGLLVLADMFLFLGILLLGWVYALRKGALKWQ